MFKVKNYQAKINQNKNIQRKDLEKQKLTVPVAGLSI